MGGKERLPFGAFDLLIVSRNFALERCRGNLVISHEKLEILDQWLLFKTQTS